ncbi:MAG: hypothetical protein ACR2NP_06095 [Pirellulaceae bacterium]
MSSEKLRDAKSEQPIVRRWLPATCLLVVLWILPGIVCGQDFDGRIEATARNVHEFLSNGLRVKLWRKDWTGPNPVLEYTTSGNVIRYSFSGHGHGIGSISQVYYDTGLRVDDVPAHIRIGMVAKMEARSRSYFSGVYCFTTTRSDGRWDNGKGDEFYVVLEHSGEPADELVGSIEVEGAVWDLYMGNHGASRGGGRRLKAVHASGPVPATVPLRPFLQEFRTRGMENLYWLYIGVAFELRGGPHEGSVTMTDIVLPKKE